MTPTTYLALTSALVLTCVWGAVAGLRRAARRIDERETMMSAPCPVCGDPRAFPLWATGVCGPPGACPCDDEGISAGRPVRIHNVTECPVQMRRAQRAAEYRRLVPDAFDANGNMLPGQSYRVLEAHIKAYPDAEWV